MRIYAWNYHLFLQMLNRNGNGSIPIKRNTAGHHLIHHDTKGIDIAAVIHKAISGLLRRSIVNGSHHIGADGIGRGRSCDTEVGNLHLSFCGNNDILRFDVSMNDILVMSRLNSSCHLNCNADGLLEGKLPFLFDVSL